MAVVLARLRMPLIYLGLAAIAVDSFIIELPRWPLLALLAVAFAIYLRLGTVRRPPVEVAMPVAGRWVAWNSPVDRVPSHHLHAYGQTYAIDLVHDPADGRRPGLAWWPLARRPDDFPGFGRPVLAPADATVVRAHDLERDHWSRTSPPAMLYLSVLVRPGDRVAVGQPLAACGNSGNSTEPHLHFQLQDHPSVLLAAGLPLRFARYQVAGADQAGVPHNLQPFTAPG